MYVCMTLSEWICWCGPKVNHRCIHNPSCFFRRPWYNLKRHAYVAYNRCRSVRALNLAVDFARLGHSGDVTIRVSCTKFPYVSVLVSVRIGTYHKAFGIIY
jgi:hypothetical protein